MSIVVNPAGAGMDRHGSLRISGDEVDPAGAGMDCPFERHQPLLERGPRWCGDGWVPRHSDVMARTRVLKFGPGRYESVTLRVWSGRRSGGTRRLKAHYVGQVPVCCEHGWEHVAPVSGDIDEFEPSGPFCRDERTERFVLLERSCKGDLEAGLSLVAEALEADLDWTWEDPCPQDEEALACL